MTTAGTMMKTTPLTAKRTWSLNTGEDGTITRQRGAVGGARRDPHPALTDPGGRGARDEPWISAPTGRGSTAEDAAPGTATTWRTSMSEEKEEEEEEGGTRAGTSFMTTLHPQKLPESWSHWRNLSTSCWWRTDPTKVKHTSYPAWLHSKRLCLQAGLHDSGYKENENVVVFTHC